MPLFPVLRPDFAVGQLLVNRSAAHSSCDESLFTSIFPLSRRTQITANYTLSHVQDDSSNDLPFGIDWVLNPFNLPARNSLRQPAFYDVDVRVVKDITLPGEGHHLDVFMNVFNPAGTQNLNFGPGGISVFGTAAVPIFTARQPLFAPNTTHFGGA